MIKYVVILLTAFILVQSQRPPYAGSSKPYPQVLPQYIEEQAAAAAAAAATAAPAALSPGAAVGAAAPAGSSGTVVNRIDANESSSSSTTTATTIPQDIPVDALGDIDLINRIKTWPKEKQPFWFINWQHIQAHRGDARNPAQPVQTQPNTRSFFAG